ncbi:unnamed protein product [Protopolystoma xenopodis]|uniref:Uncharacterized protein n=1 Tax=Protopolystoma xenopodis TaxID=117903 RepID=A0A448WBP8_9PLAT|nr:unnamed protein product [Protopolystoma xenopodis]
MFIQVDDRNADQESELPSVKPREILTGQPVYQSGYRLGYRPATKKTRAIQFFVSVGLDSQVERENRDEEKDTAISAKWT